MKPLNVIGVTPAFCHPSYRGGGIARSSTDLMMALGRLGHHVRIVSPLVDGQRRFAPPTETTFCDGRVKLSYLPEARSTRFGMNSTGLTRALAPLLAEGADVMHIHTFFSPFTHRAATWARGTHLPFVIQDHGKLTPTMLAQRGYEKKLYLALGGTRLLRQAACVVPASEVVAEFLRRWDPRIRCEACTNALDPAEFLKPGQPPDIKTPYILYLGWLDPRKNLDMLIAAFADVAGELQEWSLALVGPDAYAHRRRLEDVARKLGVRDRVVMPGPVAGDQKLGWLKQAELFALPSSGEGLSMAMLEALAAGVPCLISPGCNYPEIEEADGGEVVVLDQHAWSSALRRWCLDADRRKAGRIAAKRQFEQYHSLNRVGNRLADILDRAVTQHSSARKDHEVV